MEILTLNYNDSIALSDLVVSLGFFDGVHVAHQTLLNKTLDIASTLKKKSPINDVDSQGI